MMTVEEFYDMEAAAVDVKVDVAFFKVRSYGLPDIDDRIHSFNFKSGSITNSFAVSFRGNK